MYRRDAVAALLGGLASPFVVDLETVARECAPAPDFAAIEQHVAGRLGVAALDTATGRRLAYRADERFEPDVNSAIRGDVRDTTTPNAMLANMRVLLLGDSLSRTARDQLLAWLIGNTTGAEKLRAGLPTRWRVGDKTGMGANGATNDVAIIWPVERAPVLIAAYLADTNADVGDRNDALSQVGRAVARWIDRP